MQIRDFGTPTPVGGVSHALGEGPQWDPIRERVLWVDIVKGAVYQGVLSGEGGIEIEERFDIPGTAGAVAVSESGEWVIAGRDRLYYRSPEGEVTESPSFFPEENRRFNDGKPDPSGRFVVGTLRMGASSKTETLLRIERDGSATVLDDDLTLSNGLAWTADGTRMYSIDTMTRRIYVRDYEPNGTAVGERSVFAEVEEATPDGMTIDAEDHLWVALWGGGKVLRYAPDGSIVGEVVVPAPHVTCPLFAGADLSTLVITTATEGLSAEQRERYPLSGQLFTLRPGVSGVSPTLWAGRTP